MDVFYYYSPIYQQEILDSCQRSIQKTISKFQNRNPDFTGDYNIFAHSLGTIVSYDLLTGWLPSQLGLSIFKDEDNETRVIRDLIKRHIAKNSEFKSRLPVKIKRFFAAASPLPVMLTMRGFQGELSGRLPSPTEIVEEFYNIYHPSDPVAYRFEPIINEFYKQVLSVKIHTEKQKLKPRYEFIEPKMLNEKRPNSPGHDNPLDHSQNIASDEGSSRLSKVMNSFRFYKKEKKLEETQSEPEMGSNLEIDTTESF